MLCQSLPFLSQRRQFTSSFVNSALALLNTGPLILETKQTSLFNLIHRCRRYFPSGKHNYSHLLNVIPSVPSLLCSPNCLSHTLWVCCKLPPPLLHACLISVNLHGHCRCLMGKGLLQVALWRYGRNSNLLYRTCTHPRRSRLT